MNTTERKLAAIARILLGENETERKDARRQLRVLLCEPAAAPDVETAIAVALTQLGVPGNLYGYRYLLYAVESVVRSPNATRNATKPGGLYDATAKAFGVTPARVERAIRHAIEVAWLRGDLDVLQRYFGNAVSSQKGKTTNTEFIYTIAYAVRLSLKNQNPCYS